VERDFTAEVARIVINEYKDNYQNVEAEMEMIVMEMDKEEKKFRKTLEKGEKHISGEQMDGAMAFDLFQSYGYPREMSEEIALERGIKLSDNFADEYKVAMEKHQELSRTASVGKFKGGLADTSEDTTRLHTAAHLLLEALRRVLGPHVQQKGSNITAERLRFDFSHEAKMTPEQIGEVEKIVNDVIARDLPVRFEEMSLDEAKAKGATGVFESKYGEKVKVYMVGEGDSAYSQEICGGPHIEHTGGMGTFKISKEESSSAGVRRIKAVLLR
jgi:alanyl-tRNA synthetase